MLCFFVPPPILGLSTGQSTEGRSEGLLIYQESLWDFAVLRTFPHAVNAHAIHRKIFL